ncbi:MAG: hypothetical protein ABIH87_03425 [bacterium]
MLSDKILSSERPEDYPEGSDYPRTGDGPVLEKSDVVYKNYGGRSKKAEAYKFGQKLTNDSGYVKTEDIPSDDSGMSMEEALDEKRRLEKEQDYKEL